MTKIPISNKRLKDEESDQQIGWASSVVLHSAVVALMLLVNIAPPPPPPVKAQIIVELPKQPELPKDLLGGGPALGLPNQGQGDNPSPGKPDPNVGSSKPSPAPPPPAPAPPPPAATTRPRPTPTAPPASKPIQATEDPNAVALRQAQAAAKRAEDERKFRQEAEAREARRQAEAQRAAEEEAARKAADAKARYGGRIGNRTGTNGGEGTGTGRGNTGTSGNQGKPDGDPNSRVLDGIGRGAGTVNGFGGRGVRSFNKLSENSNRSGTVAVYACVDESGNVTDAKFQARGSSITDDDLVEACVRNARQYKFGTGDTKACGTITYTFKVQ